MIDLIPSLDQPGATLPTVDVRLLTRLERAASRSQWEPAPAPRPAPQDPGIQRIREQALRAEQARNYAAAMLAFELGKAQAMKELGVAGYDALESRAERLLAVATEDAPNLELLEQDLRRAAREGYRTVKSLAMATSILGHEAASRMGTADEAEAAIVAAVLGADALPEGIEGMTGLEALYAHATKRQAQARIGRGAPAPVRTLDARAALDSFNGSAPAAPAPAPTPGSYWGTAR